MLAPSDSGAGSLVGKSAAVSRDGNVILLGGSSDNNIGAIWMFARTGLSAWTEQGTKMVPSDATSDAAVGLPSVFPPTAIQPLSALPWTTLRRARPGLQHIRIVSIDEHQFHRDAEHSDSDGEPLHSGQH